MANTDYLPSREAELVTWVNNFNTYIQAAPTDFGLTALQATAFADLYGNFTEAYTTANNPLTRSPANVLAKNDAKKLMVQSIRSLVREIQGTPTVTNFQREELGITVRDVEPSPIGPPENAPKLTVTGVYGNTVTIQLRDAKGTARGKPAFVQGATIMSFVGEEPSKLASEWKFEGSITKTSDIDIVFPPTVAPGSKVWLSAFWYNPRAQAGPPCSAVSTYTNHEGLQMAA